MANRCAMVRLLLLAGLALASPAAPAQPSEKASPRQPFDPPILSPTQVPSAFIAQWGDFYAASAVFAYENSNRQGATTWDGGIYVGGGLGSMERSIAVELDFNLESLADQDNGGSFDVRVARQLIKRKNFSLVAGGGWLAVASYGNWPVEGGSPYGVFTAAWPLQPNHPSFWRVMQINLGGGKGRFQRIDATDLSSQGFFGSVGVELTPNLGISLGWAGKGLNSSLSLVPLRGTPIYVSLSGTNLTNVDNTGRAGVLAVSWGGKFRTANF